MNIWVILNSLGAVALFLIGMKIMSDGIQRASGTRLRRFLNSMTHTKVKALLAGIGLTSVIQSSSAVSVLTLSFVNAGLLKLLSATAIIIGANIGTTLTLWIVSFGFEVELSYLSLPILALAVPFYFSQRSRYKHWASFFVGFALIFISLSFLKDNLSFLANNDYILSLFASLGDQSYVNFFLYVLVGVFVTVVVQSSSASTSIVAVLYTLGLPLEVCAMMIIGANIGTTVTAQIAATVGNEYSKFTANFHTFFNLLGGLLFFFIAKPLILYLNSIISDNFLILAAFHTIFNVITAIVLYPFLNNIVAWVYKKRARNSPKDSLQMMHSPFSVTPELYIYEATNLLSTFAGNIKQTINYLGRMITESHEDKLVELHERIKVLEEEGDQMEDQIKTYLSKIYEKELTGENSQKIHNLINVARELENIGDLAIKSSYTHLLRRQTNSFITPKLRTHLIELQDATSTATTQLIQNLNEISIDPVLPKSTKLESKINQLHEDAFQSLLVAMQKGKIKPSSGMYYRELIQNYELIGDHIFKASKSLI